MTAVRIIPGDFQVTVACHPMDMPAVNAVIDRTVPRGWWELNPQAQHWRIYGDHFLGLPDALRAAGLTVEVVDQ